MGNRQLIVRTGLALGFALVGLACSGEDPSPGSTGETAFGAVANGPAMAGAPAAMPKAAVGTPSPSPTRPPPGGDGDAPVPMPGNEPADPSPASAVDAGMPGPGGALDAGEPDAAEPDAGEPDMGEPDAGEPDAGEPQAELCEPDPGSMTVNATIVVARGETFDGQCQRYVAGPAVGDGSQAEGQKPVFRLEDGATLLNVVLGGPAADGIHTYGDVTLRNITWEDIGEDALTIKDSGEVVLDGGAAFDGSDKVFQINAASTFRVSNFRADNAGKFIRQNGGTGFRTDVYIDRCDISNMDEAVFRTDSRQSTVTMTNTRYSNIGRGGDALWYDVNPSNITERGNTQY